MAFAENCRDSSSNRPARPQQSAAGCTSEWPVVADKLEQLSLRARYVTGFLLLAVITAAALRHTIHMYGGIPPDQIRDAALMGVPATLFSIVLLRRWRR